MLGDRFRWRESAISVEIASPQQSTLCVTPEITIDVCRDPDDNRVLECAIAGNADSIVTGDKDLLSLTSYNGIRIQTLRQLLDIHQL